MPAGYISAILLSFTDSIYGWKLVTSAKALYPRIEPINWTDTFEP